MPWLRDLQQTLSYNVGFGLGCGGLPFECPLWADTTTCRLAYVERRKAYLELVEKFDTALRRPAHDQ